MPRTLAAKADGILTWLIEGCVQHRIRGLDDPDAVVVATGAYRADEDAPVAAGIGAHHSTFRGVAALDYR